MLKEKNLDEIDVKTLDEQMLEYSKRKEKIEQLKKELNLYSEWNIIEDEGEFYTVDMFGEKWRINVELRKKLPNSFFHSPECDNGVLGYDHKTGAIIYDLWTVGKTEMMVSEGIYSDFQDTGYGIGRFLSFFEQNGFGDKVPPIHILTSDFINCQNNLQEAMNEEGYDIDIVKANISENEQRRFQLCEQIELYVKLLEDTADKSEDFWNTYIKILDDLKKEYTVLE
jgi:hypothetical protein